MEIKFKEIKNNKYNLTFSINSKDITGITGDNIIDIIALNYFPEGEVYINDKKLLRTNYNTIKRKISVVESKFIKQPYLDTVIENMEYIILDKRLVVKDPKKKIEDSLKIVGLSKSYLNRTINSLSKSELRLISIAISLLSNPDIIILDDIFTELDIKYQKKIYMLLLKLKDSYKKTIILHSNNSNILYKYTNKMIFIKNQKVFLEGKTEETYTRVNYLQRSRFEIPDIVLFTYLAKKKKNVNISYHKDIRDIIKDIYKHI
ncbi:MAG: ATP-binding cassette domain-containing protein [Firmicutes bacterium]|nr:ATP-binding cassette domain-containing protein [Bacillota bacterium]